MARVLAYVNDLAPGEVVTYGEVGRATGVGPREVGRILAGRGGECPWWRVVGSGGLLLTHRRDPAIGEEQASRLAAEGAELVSRFRVRLRQEG